MLLIILLILILNILIVMILSTLFFIWGKMEKWDAMNSSSFECGFTSYFFSRFSFSIHYFLVGLIFLFLDLELCFIMPFFNEELSELHLMEGLSAILMSLLVGLLHEWKEGKLDWKF